MSARPLRRPTAALLPLLLAALGLSGCAGAGPAAPPAAPPSADAPTARGRGPDPGRIGPFQPAPPPVPGAAEAAAAVRAVLDAQVAAWNAGDVRGFMAGYARTDSLAFISNGQLRRGWQAALYGYMRAYPDQAAMGTLSFEELDVDVLAPDVALVQGVFRLRYPDAASADDGSGEGRPAEPLGLFSLVFRRDAEAGWKIVHDHTSTSP
jgi:ketosteroid isomerase-like protein